MDKSIIKHLVFIWLGIILSPSAAIWIFKPHFENAVKEVVNDTIYDEKFINFMQKKDREESIKIEYKFVSRMLTVFRNIPKKNRTIFHNAEILRLEEEQKKLLSEMETNFRRGT